MIEDFAVLPKGVAADPLMEWIQKSIDIAGARNELPVWSLPEPRPGDPADLRWRRAMFVLMLALPGNVGIDVDRERALQGSAAQPPFDVDSVLDRAGAPRQSFPPGWKLYAMNKNFSLRGNVLCFAPSRENFGAQTIVNLGTSPCGLGDGTITLASDYPFGAGSRTSDNSDLPAMTSIWFEAK